MKRVTASLLIAIIMLLSLPLAVLAITDPDSPPQINAVYIYEDGLLEDGDLGVFIDYYLEYGTTPNETVSEAFLCIFIDTDGTTQLKSVAPYTFDTNGYGRGICWIYFNASEVTDYGLDSSNVALYTVRLAGNPTLAWLGDPPQTIANIDDWYTTGDPNLLLALEILHYADILELAWSENLIESTTLGQKLAATGEAYFDGAIANCRLMAPAAYATAEYSQVMEDIDYTTSFGAIVTGDNVSGSPVTLTEGTNIVTLTGTANFTVTLNSGTSGNVSDLVGSVVGSPVDIVAGANEIDVLVLGTVTIVVNLINTETEIEDEVVGTGLDLTTLANDWGLTRQMASGIVWFLLSIVLCSATFGGMARIPGYQGNGAGKIVMLVFDIWIIGGALLGLLDPLVAILMFIGFGAITGYFIFFRQASI